MIEEGSLRVRTWVPAVMFAAVLVALLGAPGAAAEDSIESRYVAELRATVADVRAASAHVSALRSAGRGSVWVRTATEVNPDGDPDGDGQTVSAGDGTLTRTVTTDPTVAFTTAWPTPPAVLTPGEEHEFEVSVTGAITGGRDTQGFRVHDAILLVNDRWDRTAVGVRQNCNDPIGTAPISCTEPTDAADTFTVRVPTPFGDTFSFGVGALNCGSCYVRYTYTAQSASQLRDGAAVRLLAAIQRARAILRLYLRADTRHGTSEEHALVREMLQTLRLAGGSYGAVTGSRIGSTPRRVGLARRLARAVSKEAAAAAVNRWPGIERIEALLRNPRQANRIVRREIQAELESELRRRRNAIARRALGDRLPLQLGVPLRTQVRNHAEQFALARLAKVIARIDKRGLLLSFFGEQVRVALRDIVQSARPTGKVERRTDITLAGYERREAALVALLPNTSSRLPVVRNALFEAQAALQAARFLRSDLRRLVARRCKTPDSPRCAGAKATQDRLAAADEKLSDRIGEVRTTFLIGREFDPAELRRWISGLGRMANDIRRAARRAR